MKKIIALVFLSVTISGSAFARGIPIPYCSDCEYITITNDLPDTDEYYSEEYGKHIDIAYTYKQIWFIWIPLWNTGGEYCLATGDDDDDVLFEVSPEELEAITTKHDIKLSSNPIPFWDKIGGKLVVVLFLLLGLWAYKDKFQQILGKK